MKRRCNLYSEALKKEKIRYQEEKILNEEITYALEQTQQALERKNSECQRLQQQLSKMEGMERDQRMEMPTTSDEAVRERNCATSRYDAKQ